MPNPALSQAQFDQLFDRLCEPLCAWRALREQWRRFSEEKIRYFECGNINGFTSGWTFTSLDIKSLDQGGILYIRITDGAPNTVSLYRATGAGAGDKVAEGTANDSNTATLTAQNSSNIAGTVDLGVVTANEADDNHYLVVLPDFPNRLPHIFDGYESQDFGQEQLATRWQSTLSRIASYLWSAQQQCVSFVRYLMSNYIADKLTVDDREAAGYNVSSVGDSSSGTVTVTKTGLVRWLELVMGTNTTAQAVLQKVPTAGAAAAASSNRGKLTIGSIVLAPGARDGVYNLTCSRGGSTNFGTEEVTVTFKPAGYGGPGQNDATIQAQAVLRPRGTYRAPEIGLESCTVVRDTDKTAGDAGHTEFADAEITVSGETTANTSSGILYGVVTGVSPNLTVSFYKASGAGATDLVAQVSGISNSGAFTAVAQNSSGLTVVGTAGSLPTAAEVTFDLNGLESDSNGSNVPDAWTIATADPATAATYGLIQECISEIFGPSAELRELTTGNETIEDGVVTRGGENPLLTIAE